MDPPRKRKGKEIVEDIWSMPRQRTQDQTTVNAADQQPTASFDYPSQIESPILRMPSQDSTNSNPFSSNPPLNPYPNSCTSGQVTYTGMTQTSTPRQRSQDQTTVNTADQQPTAPFSYPSQIESPILRMPPQDSSNPNPFSSNPPLNPYPYSSTSGQVTYTGRTQTSSHRGRSQIRRRRSESLASYRQQLAMASGAIQTYMIPPNQYNQIFNNTLQSQSSFPVPPPAPNCFPALQVPLAVSAEGGLLNYQPLPIDSVRPILRRFVDQFSENHTNLTPHSFGLGVLQRYLCLTPQEALSQLFRLHNWLPLIINNLLIYFESSTIYDIPFFNPPAAANVFNNQAAINNRFTTHNHSVRAPATRHQPLHIQVPPASANVFNNQAAINNTLPTQNHSVPVTSHLPIPIQVPTASTGVVNNLVAISNTFPSQNQSVPAPVTSYLPLPIQVPPASNDEFDYLPMPSVTSTQAREILEIFVRGAHQNETTLNEGFFLNLQRNIRLPEQTGLFHRYQTNGNSLQAVIDHILQYFQYWDTLQNL